MARNKEALLLLLDVGPSMHPALSEIEKVCSMLVHKKLIYSKYDEVGIVLFGTEVLDAVIVGMDVLVKKFGVTNKGKKRVCLITNAQCQIKESDEGTKEEQVTTIAKQMTAHGIKMESIIMRGKLSQDANKGIMDENDRLLNIFSKETSTRLLYVENPISLFGALRTRNIALVTVFRGHLEISPKLSIKVMVYKKTTEEKFPSMKKYSDKAPPNDKFAKHEVKIDYEHKSSKDPDKVVPPDQRIKGYPYGPQIVPISSAEWEAVKFKPEKGVKLMGFTDSSNVFRHHYMKDVYVFLPEPGNTRAMIAVSAVARAMKEMNKVAIVRCVWRQGQANVVIGVLTPNLSDKENIPDSFYLNVLPFAEDVREFQFPSFTNFPASWQPNGQQLEAAANLIKTLDLAPHGQEEVLLPDFTPNPVLERFYRYLELKSKDPDVAVPPLDGTLKKITEPDTDLLLQNKSEIDSFCRSFELKGNPLKKSRRLLGGKRSFSNDEEVKGNITAQPANLTGNASVNVGKIGDLTPVQYFEALISRRDSPDWVVKAINEMKNKIFDLVEDSHEGDNYPKALECLVALRKGCILEQEPEQFNDFLKHLWNFCQEKNLPSFCEYLASKELTLISKTEAIDSENTDDKARKGFLVKSEPKVD
ncbi:ATP-dependent DNA helicase 2 subunit KU80 isoform X2 [Glycine max]|uniref:ATP-dependent DNA helicase 2 subunit KU80 isoform X2 n=1 Tax=Glycine max TaxID=3847 RepID=UPI001B3563BA|nr:ATP-dependent DNA helicase 2 subunit KU80 isoform X2 [Glycine max]